MPIFTSSKQSNYFSSYIDIKAISTPSSPNSGIGRIFHRSSDNKLCFKLSNGTVVELGGGAGTVTTASNVGSGSGWFKTLNGTTLEFKSLIAGSNQLSITSNTNDLTVDVVEVNIKLDDLGAPDDNTDLNASATKHGLLPKLSGNSTDFLTGQGTWAVPAGGGGGGGTFGDTETQDGDAVTTVFTIAHGLGVNPNAVSVDASSIDALGDYQVDHDDTNITITYQSAPPSGTGNLVWIWIASVGGSGEANTYSNAGAGGVGITLTKSGVNLPFKSINTANSSNITVTNDAGNSEIDIDIGADVMTASSTHTMTNKTFDADGTGNSITNIENADIKAAAGIVTSKLADSANFLLSTLDNDLGAHHFDMSAITAPANPSANEARFFIEAIDANNDGLYCHIKKNGSFVKLLVF